MRGLRANHRLMRANETLKAEDVCGGSAKKKKDIAVLPDEPADLRDRFSSPVFVSVRRRVTNVRVADCSEYVGMHSGPVVGSEGA